MSPGQIDASESICAGVLLAGRYSILREIGHGGMGRVLAAYDHQLARKVAIKVLLNDGALTSPSTSANERLLREARALARLNHPNVVAIYDVTNVGRNLILAMEYIEGPTLKQWLNDKSLSLSQRLDRIAEAGEGLHAAHEAGLIHRDFKPDNVLIDCDGHARVLDFGLVGVVEPTRSKNSRATESPTLTSWQGSKSERTNPGDVLGTPLYMAPEQHLGQPTDARTDCYAFCEVLFLAVYGIHPFENVRSDPEALVQAKLAATFAPVPHRKARQRIPGIDELLNRGLAADPDLRYATMRDVLNDLAGLRQNDLESRHSLALTAIGTLLACLLLLVGVPMARTDSPSICTNREALLQAAWNDDLANRLRLRITRASTNESERLWQHLKSSIDDFAGQWQVHYDETCESNRDQTPARSSRPQAEEIRRCLNEDLDHLRGVLHALIESPSSTPRNVLRAIEGLPTPKSCADEAGSRSEGILPRDPIARKEALERRQNLARVIGEHVVHRRVETLNKLDEIIAAGSASGDEALLSLVFSHYGKILYQESRYEEADRYYSKCILYGLAFRDHFSSAYAATFLIYLRGFILGQAAGAQEAKELAASLFAAAPHQTMVEADYHHHVGLLAYVRGDLDQSILEIEKAFAAVARDFGPRSFFSVPALIDLGAIRLDRGAYAESAAASQEAIDILESMQGPESERISLAYCNLASAFHYFGRYRDGARASARAISSCERLFGADHARCAGVTIIAVPAILDAGLLDQASAHIHHVHNFQKLHKVRVFPEAQWAEHHLAFLAWIRGDLAAAREFAAAAVHKHQEEHEANRLLHGESTLLLARILLDGGDFNGSEHALNRAKELLFGHFSGHVAIRVESQWHRHQAMLELARGDHERALSGLRESIAMLEGSGLDRSPAALWTRLDMARVARRASKLELAQSQIDAAIFHLEAGLDGDSQMLLPFFLERGELAAARHDGESARVAFARARALLGSEVHVVIHKSIQSALERLGNASADETPTNVR